MKVGNMEGSPQEIKDFIENNGLNIHDYLEKSEQPKLPENPLGKIWFVIPSLLYLTSIIGLILNSTLDKNWQNLIFLIGCCNTIWLSAIVQIRFNSLKTTILIAISGLLILLMAFEVITANELLQHAKEIIKE